MIRLAKASFLCLSLILVAIPLMNYSRSQPPSPCAEQIRTVASHNKNSNTAGHSSQHTEQDFSSTLLVLESTTAKINSTSLPTDWKAVASRFKVRLDRVRNMCRSKPHAPIMEMVSVNGKVIPRKVNGWRTSWKPRGSFLVDLSRRLLVCAVQKSGSTSWHRTVWAARRKKLSLSEDQNLYTPEDTIANSGIALKLKSIYGDKLIRPVKGDDDFTQSPPKNTSFRVILARHPFARLISAWNQKFMLRINYWVNLFKTFPGLIEYKKDADANRVMSFRDFARFVSDNQRAVRSKDAHFAPATTLCRPCEYDYTYVMKAESFDADEEWVMERLGLSDLHVGRRGSPPGGSVVNKDLKANIKKFMSQLSASVIRGLYDLYRDDFEYFGYTFDFDTLVAGGFE